MSFRYGWSALEFQNLLDDKQVFADGLKIRDQKEAIGIALSRSAADEAEILSIAVEPRYRGNGLAKVLLEKHIEGLRNAGIQRLFLEVDETNVPALALYSRLGFREVGKRPAYYKNEQRIPFGKLMAVPLYHNALNRLN